MAGRSVDDFAEDHAFEVEVLRIARMIYPGSAGGSTKIDGRERDAVLVGRDVVVAIEATRSRKQAKAEVDAKKLKQLTESLARQYPTRAVRGFFVTADEPEADQRDAVKRLGGPFVTALSLSSLRKELFDAGTYLAARDDYAFGSARDPKTNSSKIEADYIALDLLERPALTDAWSVDRLSNGLLGGSKFVLTGDYGIGKSMTLREVWRKLATRWRKDPVVRIPLHLNLRDHQGQEEPSEALHRHATRIGFPDSADLVRAWRSGQVVLILDGFDEITFPGWMGRAAGLADVRRRNVALVRRFMSESPEGTGVLVAGRSHFFDSEAEMEGSLSLQSGFTHLSASDFTAKQVADYLRASGLEAILPEWMPSRPLLVGYLASLGILTSDDSGVVDSPASGWDTLLSRICEREAQIDVGLDGHTIRRIMERLASRARRTTSGRGPLRFDDLSEAFREICGYQPDEGSRVVLDRLPGLGVAATTDESGRDLPREFVDEDLTDAARAGDVFEFIASPRVPDVAGADFRDWDFLLDDLGLDVLLHRLDAGAVSAQRVTTALELAAKDRGDSGLVVELLRVALATGSSIGKASPYVSDFAIPVIRVSAGVDAGSAVLSDCIVQRLELEEGYSGARIPKFLDVHFESVEGATSDADFPEGKLEGCSVSEYSDSASNTAAILDLRLPDEARVTLTILKKVYLQRGHGRKQSALGRGLPPKLQSLVGPSLSRLQAERVLVASRSGKETVWIPVKSAQKRVRHILASPMSSKDALLSATQSR